jgi:prepilin-type N-terminal cleavage/methylation domain-containing protein
MKEVLRRIKRKGIEGFTLTEILVVVLIAAVISAIAYPLYTKSVLKARAVEAVNLLEIVKTKQASRYIVSRNYYVSFENMGQLTQHKSKEKVNTSDNRIIEIGDYKLVMNDEDKCLTAQYKDKFTLSTGYEDSKIGCSGDICESFGGVVGKAEEVCRVGRGEGCVSGGSSSCTGQTSSSCTYGVNSSCKNCGGTTLYTCNNSPAQECTPNDTRTCASGCGTQRCKGDGSGWSGTCSRAEQSKETRTACINFLGEGYTGGEATRECTASCVGGECGEWNKGNCTREPEGCLGKEQEACGCNKGGIKTRKCDTETGEWSEWGECSTAECEECEEPKIEDEEGNCVCPNLKEKLVCEGTVNKKWDDSECKCVGKEEECLQPKVRYCGVSTAIGKVGIDKAGDKECPCVDCEEAGGTKICIGSIKGEESCTCRIGGGGTVCSVGGEQACGKCGTQTCKSDGSGWNDCTGEGVCTPGEIGENIPLDPNCTGELCLTLNSAVCNDQCQWELENAGGSDDDNLVVLPIVSSQCCPGVYIVQCNGEVCGDTGLPYKTVSGTFDFAAQYCMQINGSWTQLMNCNNLYECHGLGSYYPINFGMQYCDKIQLYECPDGYGFDSSYKCVPGEPGGYGATLKRYKSETMVPIPVGDPGEAVNF